MMSAGRALDQGKATAGERLGRYELIEQLGVGGMAEIFKARATGPGGFQRTVVVKRILPANCSDPSFVRMFVAEAKILGMLHHPNVIQAYDFGESAGTLFLVLEYVDGPSLAETVSVLQGGRAPDAHRRGLPDCARRLPRAGPRPQPAGRRRGAAERRAPRRDAVERAADGDRHRQAAGLRRRQVPRVAGPLAGRHHQGQARLPGARDAGPARHRSPHGHLLAGHRPARAADVAAAVRRATTTRSPSIGC